MAECADHETRLELARGGVGVVLVSRRRLGSADCRDLRLLTLDPPIRVAIALIRRAAELTPTAAAFWDQTAPDLRVPSSGIVAPLS